MNNKIHSTIYSIGHGNKPINQFLKELEYFGIAYLVDVRSKPYSKWNPDFNQESLRKFLKEHDIIYGFMGNLLGGLPQDRSCYNADGKIMYEVLKNQSYFQEGLKRLVAANMQQHRIAIMCSESNPAECHRSKLIGQQLLTYNICIKHIVSTGKYKSQEDVMAEITKGVGIQDLFGNSLDLTSRKAH